MNINGHEVTTDAGWYTVDGHSEWRTDTSAKFIESYIKRMEEKTLRARAIIEHKRREAAEKAAQDAANELDRRAAIVRTTMRRHSWEFSPDFEVNTERQIVRALDADAAEREA